MIPIIAITGTKGKTSSARLMDKILSWLWYKTLRTDTQWVYKNNKILIDKKKSKEIYWLSCTRAPGRFLKYSYWNKNIAIFEESIWCYKSWLWYSKHRIALFTNIYADHLWRDYLQKVEDIAKAKWKFLLDNIEENWFIIFNSDDKLVLKEVKKRKNKYNLIWFWKKKKKTYYFIHINWHLLDIYKEWNKILSYNTKDCYICFGIWFEPNLYNIAWVIWSILSFIWEKVFLEKKEKIIKIINKFTPNKNWQRLILSKILNTNYIIDYAHEESSLKNLWNLANKLYSWKKIIFIKDMKKWWNERYGIRSNEIWNSIWTYFDDIYIYTTKNYKIFEDLDYKKHFLNWFKKWLSIHNKKLHLSLNIEKELPKIIKKSWKKDIICIIVNDETEKTINKILSNLNNN